jgi:hypothetical protein
MLLWRLLRASTAASVDVARSTGLATTTPKRVTKKRTERDANLENCIVGRRVGGGCNRGLGVCCATECRFGSLHAVLYTQSAERHDVKT